MALATGEYVTRATKTVVVWPAPSHDGDGELVYEPEYDTNGTPLGEVVVRDRNDRELRYWSAPDGFVNKPGFDHTDNYVKVDKRGAIERLPNGEACVIRPGEALVFNADGTVERLVGEKAQRVFDASHEKTSSTVDTSSDDADKKPVTDAEADAAWDRSTPAKKNEVSDEDFAAFEEWKKTR